MSNMTRPPPQALSVTISLIIENVLILQCVSREEKNLKMSLGETTGKYNKKLNKNLNNF